MLKERNKILFKKCSLRRFLPSIFSIREIFFFFFEIVIFTNNSILFAKLVGEVHRIEFSDNSIFLDIITEKKKREKIKESLNFDGKIGLTFKL